MDQTANIDTVKMGYEETAYTSQQSQVSRTPAQGQTEAQDALSLASMLQQLRLQKLNNQGGR